MNIKFFKIIKFFFGITLLLIYSCQNNNYNTIINLPDGFVSTVYVDSIAESVRHMAVKKNGDLYVKFRRQSDDGILAAVRDNNHDGYADSIVKFGQYHNPQRGSYSTGSRIHKGYLYYSSQLTVYRVKLDDKNLVPSSKPEIIVIDDHEHGSHEHIAKPIAFDDEGFIYVPFGSPNNACQDPKRTPLIPGRDPCPDLLRHGGIWKFKADKLNQTQKDGQLFATGLRSIVAMDWSKSNKKLYAVVHGRDDLARLWPNHFSKWESALLPSEEFVEIEMGDDFGWPYCYYDQMQNKKVLAPEYGGDGKIIGRCDQFKDPIIGFPGHWAPNDLVFYDGDGFPERYRNGAFVAFHGSTNRAPYPQSGYFVGFVPFKDGKPIGEYEIFADGFAQVDPIVNTRDAKYRPMGIAFSEDGSMFIADSRKGRIWKINFTGNKKKFGEKQLKTMQSRKLLSHFTNPHIVNDIIKSDNNIPGQSIYNTFCVSCHQSDGKGDSARFPPLAGADWVTGDKERLIDLLINGLQGEIEVNGLIYDGVMPHHKFLKDDQIADVLTYIRTNFGNQASEITTDEVKKYRSSNQLKNNKDE